MINNKGKNGTKDIEKKSLTLIVISTLGVVFGDIGTSPLYALKLSVEATKSVGAGFTVAVYGALSLITWALITVVCIKYLTIIMRADNHGEGGVFALTALLQRKIGKGPIVMILGLIGASLFFGDALITPAISVISAVEGLKVLNPAFQNYIVIISLGLISILFAVERFGTSKIGSVFGPIMLLWFITIGALGLVEIIEKPIVLKSLNPKYAYQFLSENIGISMLILGAVVLAITGAEALYSDMGHFGKKPIRISWFSVVFPCLLLNYYGQGALLLNNPKTIDNPFFRLAPEWGLIPLIILAAIATIIASQAVISGVFSITSQAVQLGYIPRLRVRHTSDEFGEVYLSKINIALFLGVAFLVVTFQSAENLAGAYGISVTGAMLVDTILATYLLVKVRRWNKFFFIPVFFLFFIIDLIFFSSNLLKFFDGGWFPIAVAFVLFFLMFSWITGRTRFLSARWSGSTKLKDFLNKIKKLKVKRVSGTAIFFVPNLKVVPQALLHNMNHNKILHKKIACMHVVFENFPKLRNDERLIVKKLKKGFYAITVRYGFQEEPNVPRVLALLRKTEFKFDMETTSFFVGRIKIVSKDTSLINRLFIYMHRMMQSATEYYQIPRNKTVEIGGVVEI